MKTMTEDQMKEIKQAVIASLDDAKDHFLIIVLQYLGRAKCLKELEDRVNVVSVLNQAGIHSTQKAIAVLEDKNQTQSIRCMLCHLIEQVTYLEAKHVLLKILDDKEEDLNLRSKAAEALALIGSRRVASRLVKIIQSREDVSLRISAAFALRFICDNRAVKPLLDVAQNSLESEPLRTACIEALGSIGDRSVISELRKLLQDPCASVRFWAADALGSLNATDAMQDLLNLTTDHTGVPGWGRVSTAAKRAMEHIRNSATEN
jgi:HEAT repeat protein